MPVTRLHAKLPIMQKSKLSWLLLSALVTPVTPAWADHPSDAQIRELGTVTVNGGRPTSLPTQIPTTIEGITNAQIDASINAADSEDALKYFPSLNVRKRYTGDYDHAVLASRASGSGNSARSLVYADGILLSNLLGNGASYTPRWGLVTPEEIERVDVLYGPFSAAYSGNSVGAVVEYLTRMPKQFEGHAKFSLLSQDFTQYGSAATMLGKQASTSLGSRSGDWSWWLNLSRQDNDGQPLTFANRLVSAGTRGSAGLPVSGAFADKSPANKDTVILGSGSQVHTLQDHAKVKLAYDVSSSLLASYTLGWWRNDAQRNVATYLRDATGMPVTGSAAQPLINIDGRQYSLTPADFAPGRGNLEHLMQGLSLKSHTRAVWDWEVAASRYDYRTDQARTPSVFLTGAPAAGTLTDMQGTGWQTLALKGVWRPGAHVVDLGLQGEEYQLRTKVSATSDWQQGSAGARLSAFNGNSALHSLYAQDTWPIAQDWKAMLGGRFEQWRAFGGELANATSVQGFGERRESSFSPKAALSWAVAQDWTLKTSLGRAVRNPTVAELYQGAIVANVIVNNDPNLRAEKSWTGELTAERDVDNGVLRATLFFERTQDALYSQTNVTVVPNVTNIQNIGRIRTHGLELAAQANEVGITGLALSGSLTFSDSLIVQNDAFPQSVGKQQPRVPQWRATALASYRHDAHWSGSLGGRYSGRQYSTLDNSDPNGFAYTGFSRFFVSDVRLRYQSGGLWSAALGIDNLGNANYWAFHPYPQRTVLAEVKLDF